LRLAHGRYPPAAVSLGMTLIDTEESYGSEELVGRTVAKQRRRVFLVC
jgi:diketogulonate reductase-like aldo/keto reductase